MIYACDGRCEKAWGVSSRPRVVFPNEKNPKDLGDFYYLADQELGNAPDDPGTNVRGGDRKPQFGYEPLNSWCRNECERSGAVYDGEIPKYITNPTILYPNWSHRKFSMPWRHGMLGGNAYTHVPIDVNVETVDVKFI